MQSDVQCSECSSILNCPCRFQRSELLALGQLSLNISNVVCGHGYTEKLYAVLRQLVTKSHYQPLTIENLNKCTFTPK